MEKGYRAWGRELTPDNTPLEAGLAWAGKVDKEGGFIGRDALLRQKERGIAKRLAIVTLDDGAGHPGGGLGGDRGPADFDAMQGPERAMTSVFPRRMRRLPHCALASGGVCS
jgi:hypothetical protein